MLGVKSVHKPLSGESANQVRNTLLRMQQGKLNQDDLKRKQFIENKGRYDFTWK